MPTNSAALRDLTRDALDEATARLIAGRMTPTAFARQMEAAIVRGHTAATIAGVAERSAPGRVRAWLTRLVGPVALSRDDRARLAAAIGEQRRYLLGFVQALPTLTPAQIVARAQLYAGAVRATYTRTRYAGWELPFAPGDGSTPCLGNCTCTAYVDEDGDTARYVWQLGAAEQHCTTCPTRAAGSPYRLERRS
mgnify:CR=1 FL=1